MHANFMVNYIYPCKYVRALDGCAILSIDLGFHQWHIECVDIGELKNYEVGDALLVKITMHRHARQQYTYSGEVIAKVRPTDRTNPEVAGLLANQNQQTRS